ncbi:phosphotransferase, partial [Candidatus Peregrinibacteria bacterium]|nr:phosphotransferase [Candidatus Peregrinibacteria bacterium]
VCGLSSSEGPFVFKVSDHSRTEDKIKRDTFASDFLQANDFRNIPVLLKTRGGSNYQNIDGRFVYVMERIDGEAPERTPGNWARLGEIAAELHNISNYPLKTLFTVESEKQKFREIAANLSFEEEYMKLVESLPAFTALSTSLIHTDIGPHNAVQKPDGTIILTDLDDVGVGPTILDLGFPLICHFVTHEPEFEKEKATAFYDAYFAKRTLPNRERVLIFDAGLFFALLYVPYGDIEKNWQRIKFAVENRELILTVFT